MGHRTSCRTLSRKAAHREGGRTRCRTHAPLLARKECLLPRRHHAPDSVRSAWQSPILSEKEVAMRFGVHFSPTDATIDVRALGRMVEAAGFESIFFPEHTHLPAYGDSVH